MSNVSPIDLETHRKMREQDSRPQDTPRAAGEDPNRELARALASVIKKWLEED